MLTFADNGTYSGAVLAGATAASYVSGPVTKIGNDAFTFPIGNDTYYAPVQISAPANATDAFSATYNFSRPVSIRQLDETTVKQVSGVEYWDISRTAGSSSINLSLSYAEGRTVGIDDLGTLTVAHYNGTTWEGKGNTATTGSVGTYGYVSSGTVSSFSPFTFGSTSAGANPLPVNIISFKGNVNHNQVDLAWATASEVNSAYFEVQRSADGKTYNAIGKVEARGNSTSKVNYSLTDYAPLAGVSYYRLRQVDLDGEVSFFGPVAARIEGTVLPLSVYPNPAFDVAKFNVALAPNETAQVRVVSVIGATVLQQTISAKSGSAHELNVNSLQPGTYVIEVTSAAGTTATRFVKQ
ncbi:MAG: T9SS type A sorting domain-containing protein [Sphingobacteriales bacterium]|nr:MAG: T9SS type A sorting domain-containing protein [Sphingobacteriales bacterium]